MIAWDGTKLAADKLADSAGLARTTTKIRRAKNGALIGASGRTSYCVAAMEWYDAGADPAAYPKCQDSDDFADLLVIEPTGRILKYERAPSAMHFEDTTFAMGSGRDYAMAAMFLGFDAVRAVEVASHFDTGCGNGVDVLML